MKTQTNAETPKGRIRTLKDIENIEIEIWRHSCNKEVLAQIILNHLKKKKLINKDQERNIQRHIDRIGELNFNKFQELRK